MKIIVDVDEVVLDLVGPWLARYNRDYSQSLAREQIVTWRVADYVIPECGEGGLRRYLADPSLYDETPPIPGALDGVEALRARGHRALFVTAIERGSEYRKHDWLQQHGFLPFEPAHSHDYVEWGNKWEIAADVIIDDRPETCVKWAKTGRYAILFTRMHNEHAAGVDDPLIFRARGWPHLIETILPAIEARHARLMQVALDVLAEPEEDAEPTPETVLQEAQRLVYGEREAAYSHPHVDFNRVADVWSAYIERKTTFTATDVAMMMVLLKVCRVRTSVVAGRETKRDSLVDIAGYAECASRVAERDRELAARDRDLARYFESAAATPEPADGATAGDDDQPAVTVTYATAADAVAAAEIVRHANRDTLSRLGRV